ncbi:MAG: hypothetical protein J6Z11_08940 [Candidatus Riflebacteria bacterium]|nr:hypothetical protein [Candidatus Riflebacteria bacterium]
MARKEYTTLEKAQLDVMRNIFRDLENPNHIAKLIDNLVITEKQKQLLRLKYCDTKGNKTIAFRFGVSERWLSTMLDEALLASYKSLRYNLRNGSLVPKEN